MSVGSVVQTIHAHTPAPASTAPASASSGPFTLASASATKPATGDGAATATNPYQSLTADLQSALLNLQSVDGGGSGAQTSGVRGHHHHQGGHGGVQADAPSLPGAADPRAAAA